MSKSVTTSLYIGGQERQTADKLAIADPAKRVSSLVMPPRPPPTMSAMRSPPRRPPTPLGPPYRRSKRAEKMLAALAGIAENRDDDAAILSQENGKIVLKPGSIRWFWSCVGSWP